LKRLAFLARFSIFEAALGVSLLLHGAVLSTHFVSDSPKQMHNRGLDVILVNSRSAQKPKDHVQALAQVNQDGGGNTDKDRRASTPMPPISQNRPGDQLEQQQMQHRLQELEARQQALLAQNGRIRLKSEEKNPEVQPSPTVDGLDLRESALAIARLEAEVSKNIEEYNKRPRKKFVRVRTQGIHEALYVENWRQKVENVGTLNYPSAARGKLFGSLEMTVTIDRNGNVVSIEIDKSSGNRTLDDAARRIIHLAAPYAPLPPAIAREWDHLVITRIITFSRNDSIETR
jgi:protein TonB